MFQLIVSKFLIVQFFLKQTTINYALVLIASVNMLYILLLVVFFQHMDIAIKDTHH